MMNSNANGDKNEPGLTRDILHFFLVGIVFLGLAIAVQKSFSSDAHQWLSEFRRMLQGSELANGLLASSVLFILIGGTAISLGVPRLWVSGAAGAIYGVVLGITLAMVASIIGATTVYLLGRRQLSALVERRVGGQLTSWRLRFRQNAFWWVLYARLFPFSNATLTSLICGSCRVSFSLYLAASFIGFLPLTFVFASFGSGGVKGNTNQVLLGFGLLFLALIARLLFRVSRPGKPAR